MPPSSVDHEPAVVVALDRAYELDNATRVNGKIVGNTGRVWRGKACAIDVSFGSVDDLADHCGWIRDRFATRELAIPDEDISETRVVRIDKVKTTIALLAVAAAVALPILGFRWLSHQYVP
jgi:hypothetical protein